MSSSALAAGLLHLRDQLAAQQRSGESDEQLLDDFTARRDEAAFAVLVRRHGPMVLHVCRRVLGHDQDAEDAFQATFLVLAQNAASLRNKSALAGWLHGTAYRTAMKAKQSTVRRRKHEEQTPPRPLTRPSEELLWCEVRALLDQEIAGLPEIYRSVFVLCCLEDLSQTEAAQRLGLKVRTVSNRVAEARKRLAQRLSRRGVELMAVLAASKLAVHSASAMPAGLLAGTTKAAMAAAAGEGLAGLVSAPVAGLVKSVTSTSFASKLVIVLSLAAGAATVGVGITAWQRTAVAPEDTPRAEAVAPPAAKPSETIKVQGRVLDPDGKPVEGARLYWPKMPKTPRTEEDIQIRQTAKTDAEGRFRFELPRTDLLAERRFPLLAAADGFGIDWAQLPKADAPAEMTLRLVKDQPIEGRIISTEGKPLAGVRVRAVAVLKPAQGKLDDFLAAWKQDWRTAYGQQFATSPALLPDEKSSHTVTDKEGRFRVHGAGSNRLVMLRLQGAGVSQTMLHVIARAGYDASAVNKVVLERTSAEERRLREPLLLYGPTLEYVAPAGRRIEGTVREVGTGKPVPGFVIFCGTGYGDGARVLTDKDGHYRLNGLPKKEQYLLAAEPPANSAWLRSGARVQDREGLQPIAVDFTVARGINVSGRILDRKTSKGVRGSIRFVPLSENTFAGKPGYDSYKYENLSNDVAADGRFRFTVMPGPIVLMAQVGGGSETANGGLKLNPFKQAEFDATDHEHVKITENGGDRYFTSADNRIESMNHQNAVKVLDLAPDAGTATVDLFVERGEMRTIRIEDSEGKPLTGTTIGGMTASWPISFTVPVSTCTVYALDPKKPRRLFFLHAKRNLAGTLLLRGDEKEPVVVRLDQAGVVMGRVLERDGQPLAGAIVSPIWPDRNGNELYRAAQKQSVRTDKDGRFRFEGIVPEVKFGLGIVKGGTYFLGEPRLRNKQVKPGGTLDLGDVRVKPGP